MASGSQRDSEGVRVVRTGVRRDVWAVTIVAAGIVGGVLLLRTGAAPPPAPPPPSRPVAPTTSARPTPTTPDTTTAHDADTPRLPRTRGAQLRALHQLGIRHTPGPDGKPQLDAAPVIDALRAAGVHEGIAAFGRPGTDPPKSGLIVPDDFVLPEGYVRHYQSTDDGQALPPILMFHPDYTFTDEAGNPVPIPPDRVVPPELAPPGFPVQQLDVPAPGASR